ncbi:hypothetical protein KY360_03320 [Candidatus Woesearchaeota archaeon]|nr:hypothetical protein [Candidatus Woesearchaeota archaeon]
MGKKTGAIRKKRNQRRARKVIRVRKGTRNAWATLRQNPTTATTQILGEWMRQVVASRDQEVRDLPIDQYTSILERAQFKEFYAQADYAVWVRGSYVMEFWIQDKKVHWWHLHFRQRRPQIDINDPVWPIYQRTGLYGCDYSTGANSGQTPAEFYVVRGGRGSPKSYIEWKDAVDKILKYDGYRVVPLEKPDLENLAIDTDCKKPHKVKARLEKLVC